MSTAAMNTQQITGIAIKIALVREGKEIHAKILADLIRYAVISLFIAWSKKRRLRRN